MKRLILALIGLALALAACSAKSATTATTATTAAPATTIATTTSTTDLASLRSQWVAAVTPLDQAINTWHTEYAQLQSQAYVSPSQIAAVTNPVITVMQTTISNLSNLSFPVAIESDVRSFIAALSAFEGDERQVVLEWPNAQSVQAQGTADVAKVNAASALVNADLSG
jgi:hypothetical protein